MIGIKNSSLFLVLIVLNNDTKDIYFLYQSFKMTDKKTVLSSRARKVQSRARDKKSRGCALRHGAGTKIFGRVKNIGVLILMRPVGIDSKE
jgi:hypothetical protein